MARKRSIPVEFPYIILKTVLQSYTGDIIRENVVKSFKTRPEALEYLSRLARRAETHHTIQIVSSGKLSLKTTSFDPMQHILFRLKRIPNIKITENHTTL